MRVEHVQKRMKKRLVGKIRLLLQVVVQWQLSGVGPDMISADFIGDSNTVSVPARGGIGEKDVKK